MLDTMPVASPPPRAAERTWGSAAAGGWDLQLLCVAAYIAIAVGRVHQLFPALGVLRPAIVAGALAIALYLIDPRPVRQVREILVPTTWYLLALLAWMALSVSGSAWPGNSFDLLADNFIKTVLMYLVIAGSVRGLRDVERMAGAYLASAALYAAVVLVRFDLGDGDAWRLGRLYYYDANDLATFLVTAMPLALYFLHAGRRRRTRALAAAALAVLALGFVYTGSRGGFIALLAVVAFVVWRYTAIPFRWRTRGVALVAVVVAVAASEQYWRQMGTILSDADYNRTEETGRLQIWRRGVGYMLDYPLLGVGPNNFQSAEGTLAPFAARQQFGIGVRWNAAHNTFIQAGAELGIPGLVLLVALMASAFAALRGAASSRAGTLRRRRRRAELTQALTASLIGFVVGAFFLSLAYAEILYTLLALCVGLQKVTRGRDQV